MDPAKIAGNASGTENTSYTNYSGDISGNKSIDTGTRKNCTEGISVFNSDDMHEVQSIDTYANEDGSESIFSLINQLSFNVEEDKKEQFFNGLETRLANSELTDEDIYSSGNKEEIDREIGGVVINYLMGLVDGNGQVSV